MTRGKEERLDDIERLYRMRVDTLPVLRAALREYLTVHPGNRHQIDPVRDTPRALKRGGFLGHAWRNRLRYAPTDVSRPFQNVACRVHIAI